MAVFVHQPIPWPFYLCSLNSTSTQHHTPIPTSFGLWVTPPATASTEISSMAGTKPLSKRQWQHAKVPTAADPMIAPSMSAQALRKSNHLKLLLPLKRLA